MPRSTKVSVRAAPHKRHSTLFMQSPVRLAQWSVRFSHSSPEFGRTCGHLIGSYTRHLSRRMAKWLRAGPGDRTVLHDIRTEGSCRRPDCATPVMVPQSLRSASYTPLAERGVRLRLNRLVGTVDRSAASKLSPGQ